MFKDFIEKQPCSVSKELVEYVANLNSDMFKTSTGEIKLACVLFHLGFEIKPHRKNMNFYTLPNVRIRDPLLPYKTYLTTVYNGQLRNQVDHVDESKRIRYNKHEHWLKPYYDKYEVLNITNLQDKLPIERFEDISEIGTIDFYHA